jgi:hypothetical protein
MGPLPGADHNSRGNRSRPTSFDNADPTGNAIDLYFEPSDPREETAAIF